MGKLVQGVVGWVGAFFGACLAVSAVTGPFDGALLFWGLLFLGGGFLLLWGCTYD